MPAATPLRRVLTGLGLVLASAWYALGVVRQARHPLASDFAKYWGQAVLLGGGLYTPLDPGRLGWEPGPVLPGSLTPPPGVLLSAPLGWVEYAPAFVGFTVLGLVLGLGGLAWEARRQRWPVAPVLLAGLVFPPTWLSVVSGQYTLLQLGLLVAALEALRRGREVPAGLCLGLAACLKLFFGLPLLWMLLTRRWRGGLAGGALFGVLWLVAELGWPGTTQSYLGLLAGIDWAGMSWNASLTGVATRLGWPTLGRLSGLGLLALWGLWAARRGSDPARGLGATIPAMLLISPLGWLYYFPLLAPAALSAGRRAGGWVLVALLLACVPHMMMEAAELVGPLGWLRGWHHHIALWLLLGAALRPGAVLRPGAALRPGAGPGAAPATPPR